MIPDARGAAHRDQRIWAGIEKNLAPDTVADALISTWLRPLCAVSPYLEKVAKQYPEALDRLILNGELSGICRRPSHREWVEELLLDLDTMLDDSTLDSLPSSDLESLQQAVIRRFRHRKMFRILWRDLTGASTVYDTLHELSTLADACIVVADEWAYTALSQRYGKPRNSEGKEQRLSMAGCWKNGWRFSGAANSGCVRIFSSFSSTL